MKPDQAKQKWAELLATRAVWDELCGRRTPVVVRFRRTLEIAKPLRGACLWVTASQRFTLYVDGELFARGPSRSDPSRWNVRQISLPALASGRHVIAVRAWHLGERSGIGQMGNRPFLLCCGVEATGRRIAGLCTGESEWKCRADESRDWIDRPFWEGRTPYFVAGSGERFTAAKAERQWNRLSFDDRPWAIATPISAETGANPWGNRPLEHELQPDPLPMMREKPVAFRSGLPRFRVRRNTSFATVLDRGSVTNAYPTVHFRGGKGARITLVWSESLYNADGTKRRHSDVAGARFFGTADELRLDGRKGQWQPLWFRSFRYLHVTVAAGKHDVWVERIGLAGTGFPLTVRIKPRLKSAEERRLWNVSVRTAQLCAHETLFDCPHYEQAQFSGDSCIQCLYHYLICKEDRLARKAIDDLHASRLPEGILQSRFPSQQVQVLPTFSLYWLAMLHDFHRHRGDGDFVRKYLATARGIVAWFLDRQRSDGMLGRIPYAPFLDWTPAFASGNAPQRPDGGSAILSLMLASACQRLAALERTCGYAELAQRWERSGRGLKHAAMQTCWDASRGMVADLPDRTTFSVHGQVEAILAGAVGAARGRAMLQQASGPDVTQPGSFYYRFYQWQAYLACGWEGRAEEFLQLWVECLKVSKLNTWPETAGENPRSDCHAWSVLPALVLAARKIARSGRPSQTRL